ncbi:MAG: PAS domain S-box protein [Caldilineaceae bacterium]
MIAVSAQNGVTRHWHTLKMPLRNEEGAITGLISSARDMTEHIRAEEELRRSYEILALPQRVSQSGVWDWDIAHNHTFWSAEYYALYGFPPETELAMSRGSPPFTPTTTLTCVYEVLDLDGDWNEEFRILHPERGERWLVGIGQVAYDEAGNATRFTGVNLDITERKVIDGAAALSSLFAWPMQDAIISTDLEFRIRSWNRGAEQVYGWSAAEAVGQTVSELLATTYVEADTDPSAVIATFLSEGRWQGEVIHPHKNGGRLFISNTTTLLRDEAGNPSGAVAVNRDATARNRPKRYVSGTGQCDSGEFLDHTKTRRECGTYGRPRDCGLVCDRSIDPRRYHCGCRPGPCGPGKGPVGDGVASTLSRRYQCTGGGTARDSHGRLRVLSCYYR